MSVTTPPTVTALPTPPSTASPGTFDSRGDAFLGALPTMQTETNALAANVYGNAVDAASSAYASSISAGASSASAGDAGAFAVASASSAGAAMWVSGTTYSLGAAVWSPANRVAYRRIIAGAGATDPSADPTNWALVGALGPTVVVVTGTTQTASANGHYVMTNVAASTLTLPASPVSGDTVWATFTNGLATNAIARNGNTIMALAQDMTVDLPAGLTVQLRYANSDWRLV